MILTDTMSHFINSGQPVAFPGNFAGLSTMVKFGTIAISLPQLLTIVVGVATVLGLQLFLYRQKQGRAFRAIAQSTDTARILGIPLTRAGIYSFALAGLIGGVAAVLTAATLGSAGPGLGDQLAIKATVIVLVAGGGNLWGGLGMAFGVGLADALTQAYLPGRWSDAIVFGVMMIGIIIRPNGVFGSRS
jgi:branched-chain amino acid transport system permease protein